MGLGPNSKRGKRYPNCIGTPQGKCKICRNKAESIRQKNPIVKERRKKRYQERGEKYKLLLNVQNKLRCFEKKKELIKYKGGKCERCGFRGHENCFDFHHIDPTEKDFTIKSSKGHNLEKLKKEVDKCQLLCANCHREVHAIENMVILTNQLYELSQTEYNSHTRIGE